MKLFFAKILRRLGLLQFEFLVERHTVLPESNEIVPGAMALIESGKIQKWACMSNGRQGSRLKTSPYSISFHAYIWIFSASVLLPQAIYKINIGSVNLIRY
jgi:hypothetical protein